MRELIFNLFISITKDEKYIKRNSSQFYKLCVCKWNEVLKNIFFLQLLGCISRYWQLHQRWVLCWFNWTDPWFTREDLHCSRFWQCRSSYLSLLAQIWCQMCWCHWVGRKYLQCWWNWPQRFRRLQIGKQNLSFEIINILSWTYILFLLFYCR